MSQKMLCPGCGSCTSAILAAVQEGRPCPVCGLSAAAIAEIDALQQSRADEQLKTALEAAIKERDAARTKAAKLEQRLDLIRRTLDGYEDA